MIYAVLAALHCIALYAIFAASQDHDIVDHEDTVAHDGGGNASSVGGALHVHRSGDARDRGLNISVFEPCGRWRLFWEQYGAGATLGEAHNVSAVGSPQHVAIEVPSRLVDGVETQNRTVVNMNQTELDGLPPLMVTLGTVNELEEAGMDGSILDEFAEVRVDAHEVCGDHPSTLWINDTADAAQFGVADAVHEAFCLPFSLSLEADVDLIQQLEQRLLDLVVSRGNGSSGSALEAVGDTGTAAFNVSDEHGGAASNANRAVGGARARRALRVRIRRQVPLAADDGAEAQSPATEEHDVTLLNGTVAAAAAGNASSHAHETDFYIDLSNVEVPVLYVLSQEATDALGLEHNGQFGRYQNLGFNMIEVCKNVVPTVDEEQDFGEFDDFDLADANVGINVTQLVEERGLNLSATAETLRDDLGIDNIFESLKQFEKKAYPSSYLTPIFDAVNYDARSPPIIFKGQPIVVRTGLYIESLSQFDTKSMDYEMDVRLLMSWRDVRLRNKFAHPILIKDADDLGNIWRPDPFFVNAKDADYHDVTFLNFLVIVFSEGQVYWDTRMRLKPSCNLLLCKYPHDKQVCLLKMSSYAYPQHQVRFKWFSEQTHAIRSNPTIQLPELDLIKYETEYCDGTRELVNYTCLKAVLHLERETGFYIAQTYVPTSLALMFSWVGVWLPEEFMEGRIGVAITVLLTLSTESAGAREHLPAVSYMKAIDIWFGVVIIFVFVTLLQTLFVIGYGRKSEVLKKAAMEKHVCEDRRAEMIKTGHRYYRISNFLDRCCRFLYPLAFVIFLIAYFFVITTGEQGSCTSQSPDH